MLDNALILALYSKQRDKENTKNGPLFITAAQGSMVDDTGREWAVTTLVVNRSNGGKVKASHAGRYEGKVGTMRRTRKGATRRNANGRRFYNGLDQVVAYKV